jgi:tungstate transport system substrate-binding protein
MRARLVVAAVAILAAGGASGAQERHLTIAATTSIQDSGLFNILLPKFYARTGIIVHVKSVTSAQALSAAGRGEVDLVIANDPVALDRFAHGAPGVGRHKLMYNDFVIVGPIADPAGARATGGAAAALREIARTRSVFMSRADDSGPDHAEQRLWQAAQVNPKARSGDWFREVGLGMAATLHDAARESGYVLVDRGTWLAEGDKERLTIISQGDAILFNQYEAVLVTRAGGTAQQEAEILLDWLLSPEGQDAISSLRSNGEQLFFSNTHPQPPAEGSR